MTSFFLNIPSNNTSGFCNQLYSIVGVCRRAKEYNIKYIFLSKYLMQINSDNYCNISDVIDIDKTNLSLNRDNIKLIDGNTFTLKMGSIKYGTKNWAIDITQFFDTKFLQDKIISIDTSINLNDFGGDPCEFYKKKFLIEIKDPIKLFITYFINDIVFCNEFETNGGYLKANVNINYRDLNYVNTLQWNNCGEVFCYFIKKFVFKDTIVRKSLEFIQNNIDTNKKINTIHLRLEEDAIKHWGKLYDLKLYKSIVEKNYINLIKQFIDPDSITILLASEYDNNVVKFLRENKYNYIETPKMDSNREISAIIDMHIGQSCNNICIGIIESSFSISLFERCNPQVKKLFLYYTNIEHQGCIYQSEI
jgi:hypothetical protein